VVSLAALLQEPVRGVAHSSIGEASSGGSNNRVVANGAAPAPSVAECLRELADLHRDGVLTDEEFAAAKAKVLGGL